MIQEISLCDDFEVSYKYSYDKNSSFLLVGKSKFRFDNIIYLTHEDNGDCSICFSIYKSIYVVKFIYCGINLEEKFKDIMSLL